jgi:hypothetical protein
MITVWRPQASSRIRRLIPPDEAAHELTARSAGVHDSSGRKGADEAGHAYLASARVGAHLDEFGAKGESHLFALSATHERALAAVQLLHRIGRCALGNELGVFLDDRAAI